MLNRRYFTTALMMMGIVFFVMASSSWAIPWRLGPYTPNWEKTVFPEVKKMRDKGFLPIGLTYNENQLWVLYTKGGLIKDFTKIGYRYFPKKQERTKIPEVLKKGGIVTGLTVHGNMMHLIYVKSAEGEATGVTNYAMKEVSPDMAALKKVLNTQWKAKFYPTSILYDAKTDKVRIFFLKGDFGLNLSQWSIQIYKPTQQAVTAGINAQVKKGWEPFGLIYKQKLVIVLYMK